MLSCAKHLMSIFENAINQPKYFCPQNQVGHLKQMFDLMLSKLLVGQQQNW